MPQLADRYIFLFVFQAEFPDIRTGYVLVLVIGFEKVNHQPDYQSQQTYQPQRRQ